MGTGSGGSGCPHRRVTDVGPSLGALTSRLPLSLRLAPLLLPLLLLFFQARRLFFPILRNPKTEFVTLIQSNIHPAQSQRLFDECFRRLAFADAQARRRRNANGKSLGRWGILEWFAVGKRGAGFLELVAAGGVQETLFPG